QAAALPKHRSGVLEKRRRRQVPSRHPKTKTRAPAHSKKENIMAHTEVLLIKPVDGLGGEGDQVKVRAGYARNYLLPRGIAVPLTGANRKQVEALKKRRATREAQELTGAKELAGKLEKTPLAFSVKTGEGGKMFG